MQAFLATHFYLFSCGKVVLSYLMTIRERVPAFVLLFFKTFLFLRCSLCLLISLIVATQGGSSAFTSFSCWSLARPIIISRLTLLIASRTTECYY